MALQWWQQSLSRSIQMSAQWGLTLQDVTLEGAGRTNAENVQKDLKPLIGKSIFSFDLENIQKTLLKYPWVASVQVRRALPQGLVIVLEERRPKALWRSQGKLFLLDEEGKVVNIENIKPFSTLPLLVGEEANQEGISFLNLVKGYPSIFKVLKFAVWVSKRRWDIYLQDKDLKVQLAEDALEKSLSHLQDLLEDERIQWDRIDVLDLRLEGRAFFLLKKGEKA
ncbi:uncharacterized protein LOC111320527 [Stylophora pistillata]|uniref:uncharacterized protein LOC111320527 n=1 Tax=Stylophora pistillata TaxID=50429 RepID=UPI000C053835|nr:uncharacterized protein LOC111320527 [Stylophora pistillata]